MVESLVRTYLILRFFPLPQVNPRVLENKILPNSQFLPCPQARNPQLFQVLRDELKGSTMRDGPQKEEPSDLIEALEHLRVDLKLRRRFAKDIVEAFIEELE